MELNATELKVDTARIGLVGWSLGGYYVPRATAFDKRVALAVAWGANYDWAAVQEARRRREGENPVPHYWDHVHWVFGASDMDDFIAKTKNMRLEGVVEKITVPFLVTHGIGDRQIPVEYARKEYEAAVSSPKRELRIFTQEEGGAEHIGLDNMPYVSQWTADWVAETFAELTGGADAAEEAAAEAWDVTRPAGEAGEWDVVTDGTAARTEAADSSAEAWDTRDAR